MRYAVIALALLALPLPAHATPPCEPQEMTDECIRMRDPNAWDANAALSDYMNHPHFQVRAPESV